MELVAEGAGEISMVIRKKELDMKEHYWSRFSRDYDARQERVAGADLLAEISGELNALFNLGDVVELGCGTGYFTQAIAKNAKSVVATDLSEEQLSTAATRFENRSNVRFEKQDCTRTTLDSGAYDTVVAINVLHVIEHPEDAIAESLRLLKAGGRLVAISFTTDGMTPWEKAKMGFRFLQAWGKPPKYTHVLSLRSLGAFFEAAGFSTEEMRIVGNRTKAIFGTARKPSETESSATGVC